MRNKIIGIICAMDKEMTYYHEHLQNVSEEVILSYHFFKGSFAGNNIIFTKCGIGKANAAALTLLFIEHFHPDFMVNTGVAGGFDQNLKTLDIVVADKVFYHDVCLIIGDESDRRRGQLQDLPLAFRTSIILNDRLARLDYDLHFGSIATGDIFADDYPKMKKLVDEYFADMNVKAFDMESAAIAQMCFQNKTEFIIVRAISDMIGGNQHIDYYTFCIDASRKAADLILRLIAAD